jgi:glyoxylase-like metal-dependent hydrolase (beta-lactamase superfamily II)
MARLIDVMHLGRDRVIAAHELRGGLVVDPGPSTGLEALLAGLKDEPRALLLTHIHLDHAGASGVLARRFPDLHVYVHEAGAPHLADPERLLRSAARLYGDEMERLWGEVAPVPEERIVVLRGGEEVEGLRVAYVPGHAGHHVAYLDSETGDAYVGDVAGVRIPPGELTLMPTPPPEIDVDAWLDSLATVREWRPKRLHLTHFGPVDAVEEQLERAGETLRRYAAAAERGRDRFFSTLAAELEAAADPEVAVRMRQAAPPEQLWLGLERYLRKRDQA